DTYRKDLRQELRLDALRQRAVDSTIVITDAEVDAFLRNEGARSLPGQGPGMSPQQPPAQAARQEPQVLGLAQILVEVPEGSSSSRVQELRQRAEQLLARVRGGADFAGVAAEASDGPEALNGGELGVR